MLPSVGSQAQPHSIWSPEHSRIVMASGANFSEDLGVENARELLVNEGLCATSRVCVGREAVRGVPMDLPEQQSIA